MDVGLGLPHLGSLADPDAIRTVAVAAEQAGLTSVWAMDRLLRPVSRGTLGYPGRSDGSLPTAQDVVLDPLVALTVAATVTERVRLGTDVLVAPWYPPVLLARSLAAIDQVSGGRLLVGLGLGLVVDEFDAVGAPIAGRGRRLEEVLDVLRAVWADEVVDVTTTHERIAPSVDGTEAGTARWAAGPARGDNSSGSRPHRPARRRVAAVRVDVGGDRRRLGLHPAPGHRSRA